MGSSGITPQVRRSTKLIAAVLGGQMLALSIMLSAAYALSSWSEPEAAAVPECLAASAAPAPGPAMKSRELLNLSIGWIR